jgi:hypothetical protein
MKKATWCWLAVLMLLAGCMVGARLQVASLGDKPIYRAELEEKPFFTIVTDGSMHRHVVRNAVLVGATYEGQIFDPQSRETIEFHSTSGGRTLRLGGRHYQLAEGRLFLVSVKGDPFRVTQFNVSEEELRHPPMTDERIAAFFQGR